MLRLLAEARRRRRRGLAGQRPRRAAERLARRTAVACTRWLAQRGQALDATAARLGLERSTLARWCRQWRHDQLALQPLGRSPAYAEPTARHAVLTLFAYLGPQVGLPALRRLFPDCPKAELVDLLARCRARYRRAGVLVHALRWVGAGRVWAVDGCDAPTPIDGCYSVILAVRDLASGALLASLPAAAEDGPALASLLEALFREHGPPLALKSDNGACRSAVVQDLLRRYGVLHLLSPPGLPPYNGAIEAGFGGLKTAAHWEAARHDRPGLWTADDLEAARCRANALHRPWGLDAPTPDDAWSERTPITTAERVALHQSLWVYRHQERQKRGARPGEPLRPPDPDALFRAALSQALIQRGYLTVRRRRIAPPLSIRFLGNISR